MPTAAEQTLRKIWEALPAPLGALVQEEAHLDDPEIERVLSTDGARYYARLELVRPRVATMHLVFDLRLAIACAARKLGRAPEAIRDEVASDSFGGDGPGAMGECVEDLCAAIDDAIRAIHGDGYHVEFREGSQQAPDLDALGPVTVAHAALELGSLARGTVALVVPDDAFASDEAPAPGVTDDALASNEAPAPVVSPAAASPAAEDPLTAEDPRLDDEPEPDTGGPLLSREELDALREATQSLARGSTMVVASEGHRDGWREVLTELAITFDFVADQHQMLAGCRERTIDSILIDADACPSGGLAELAAIRGKPGVPARRIVVASRPTRAHLVACLGGGASEYLCRPVDPATLLRAIG